MYQSAPDFYPQASGWLGYSSNQLYFFPLGQGEDAVTVLSPETLAVENKLEFEGLSEIYSPNTLYVVLTVIFVCVFL